MAPTFRLSVGSHLAAIAVGAVAAAAYLTVYSNSAQSIADYISAICAKSFGSAPAAEAPYLAENVSAMTKMMIDMSIRPSGDVDTDFVAMMVPHIAAMGLSLGQPLPPSVPSPDQIPIAAMSESKTE